MINKALGLVLLLFVINTAGHDIELKKNKKVNSNENVGKNKNNVVQKGKGLGFERMRKNLEGVSKKARNFFSHSKQSTTELQNAAHSMKLKSWNEYDPDFNTKYWSTMHLSRDDSCMSFSYMHATDESFCYSDLTLEGSNGETYNSARTLFTADRLQKTMVFYDNIDCSGTPVQQANTVETGYQHMEGHCFPNDGDENINSMMFQYVPEDDILDSWMGGDALSVSQYESTTCDHDSLTDISYTAAGCYNEDMSSYSLENDINGDIAMMLFDCKDCDCTSFGSHPLTSDICVSSDDDDDDYYDDDDDDNLFDDAQFTYISYSPVDSAEIFAWHTSDVPYSNMVCSTIKDWRYKKHYDSHDIVKLNRNVYFATEASHKMKPKRNEEAWQWMGKCTLSDECKELKEWRKNLNYKKGTVVTDRQKKYVYRAKRKTKGRSRKPGKTGGADYWEVIGMC